MKYMIQLNVPAAEWDDVMSSYSKDDMAAMFAHMGALNNDLTSAGEWVEGRGLGGPSLVKTVRAGNDGRPQVTDGPAQAGPILAGYWVVDVTSEERALEIAARASACPGPGGKPGSEPVEVHLIPEDPTEA
ncbi:MULTISPECIES: YciI family protein [unclassified Streptomyces]|uniref:YciI family protein n=1 Tax=unclassified Streptomyces TaxID=2593676 RepID=UPI0022548633|nr:MULTISPECIES: YciI family protein [unclassified Streptomyces]MCX4524171.1 YciI family protein [Streptomyces sp. NBC_01551]MCX4545310.1 YciI family protein [Streptomyces sp. NBC_01565]